MSKRFVILESPFAGDVERNKAYAMEAMRDSLMRGEAPFASHLLYTQMLDDLVPAERQMGIDAGLEIGKHAVATVVYVDLGISSGMEYGIANAEGADRLIEYRSLTNPKDQTKEADAHLTTHNNESMI